jgi:hypothetical protein
LEDFEKFSGLVRNILTGTVLLSGVPPNLHCGAQPQRWFVLWNLLIFRSESKLQSLPSSEVSASRLEEDKVNQGASSSLPSISIAKPQVDLPPEQKTSPSTLQDVPRPNMVNHEDNHDKPSDHSDEKRTLTRYKNALDQLKNSLKASRANWKLLQFPELEDIPVDISPSRLREEIDKIFDARQESESLESQTWWPKCKQAVCRACMALTPLAKNVLIVAKEAQSVCVKRVPR